MTLLNWCQMLFLHWLGVSGKTKGLIGLKRPETVVGKISPPTAYFGRLLSGKLQLNCRESCFECGWRLTCQAMTQRVATS
jgi:hypothetical protein